MGQTLGVAALESEQELGTLSSGMSNVGRRAAVPRGAKFILGCKKNRHGLENPDVSVA